MDPFIVEALVDSIKESLLFVTNVAVTSNVLVSGKILVTRLKREKTNSQNKIISNTSLVDKKTVEERKRELSKEEIGELKPYVKKLEEYTSKNNLKTAYRNLKSLKVKRNYVMILMCMAGMYDIQKNTIRYTLKSTIGHEFLHMASSYYDAATKTEYCGFFQTKGFDTIGEGLNEGYTELLASRIYEKNHKVGAYKKEVGVTRLLELFFDNPKEMEDYYFNHNLPGLIHHMEQYAPREEIIKLIHEIDEMHNLSNILSPISIYQQVKIQMKLYEWFRLKNKNSQKLESFESFLKENKITLLVFKKQKIKLQKKFQKGTPVFDIEEYQTLNSFSGKKIDTNQVKIKENTTNEKQQEILRELLPYQKLSFAKLCSEVFQVPEAEINILQATKLYCLMTNIDFLNCDRKTRNIIARQVQTLILPENEKKPLEKRNSIGLQKKLDSTWNVIYKGEKSDTKKII